MAGVLEGGCAPSAPAGSDGFALDGQRGTAPATLARTIPSRREIGIASGGTVRGPECGAGGPVSFVARPLGPDAMS